MWDYPRPPAVVADDRRVTVAIDGEIVADTTRAVRVLETSHPPVFYVPVADIDMAKLRANPKRSFCEYKGTAIYWDITNGAREVGWSYPTPSLGYETLEDRIAFYAGKVDCTVDGEAVQPQPGDFYGGWITAEITGPFKGGPGTSGW